MNFPALAFAALGATMLAAGAAPALAGDAPKQGTSMSYADLDLETAAGRAELNQRFDQAARDKCGMIEGQKANYKVRSCYKTTGEQYRHYAEAVLAQHDRAEHDKKFGLAAR
jgi:UrcA family protein